MSEVEIELIVALRTFGSKLFLEFVGTAKKKKKKLYLVINEVEEKQGCNSSPVLQEHCNVLSESLIYPDSLSPLLRFCVSAARGF